MATVEEKHEYLQNIIVEQDADEFTTLLDTMSQFDAKGLSEQITLRMAQKYGIAPSEYKAVAGKSFWEGAGFKLKADARPISDDETGRVYYDITDTEDYFEGKEFIPSTNYKGLWQYKADRDYATLNDVIGADDNEETATARFDTYFRETAPLIDYYKSKNVLKEINADGSIEDVWTRLISVI